MRAPGRNSFVSYSCWAPRCGKLGLPLVLPAGANASELIMGVGGARRPARPPAPSMHRCSGDACLVRARVASFVHRRGLLMIRGCSWCSAGARTAKLEVYQAAGGSVQTVGCTPKLSPTWLKAAEMFVCVRLWLTALCGRSRRSIAAGTYWRWPRGGEGSTASLVAEAAASCRRSAVDLRSWRIAEIIRF